MKHKLHYATLLLSLSMLLPLLWVSETVAGTGGLQGSQPDEQLAMTAVVYTPTNADFPNPERGFYHHAETHTFNHIPLSLSRLQSYRRDENITLVIRIFYLDSFVSSPISQTYLDAMQTDFDTLRAAGLKAVVRFAYTYRYGSPPYGDATPEWVNKHIQQLTPLLQANSDVIAVLQAGFIGLWGEWCFTDHFVDDPSNPNYVTAEDWEKRRQVLNALLDVLPTDRMVQVRTPVIKQSLFGASSPLNEIDAYSRSDIARTGHHNDCFLADKTDAGTYPFPVEEYQAYVEKETQYLPMGGETCRTSSYSGCSTALAELERFHWSYLNMDYNPDVVSGWRAGNCLGEIKQRLGYRFTLVEGAFSPQVKPGDQFNVSLVVRNDGWAAPFNPRDVKLLLRSTTDGTVFDVALPEDPRHWLPGENGTYTLAHAICTPESIPVGDYEMLLSLPDPQPSLRDRPEYAIHFANEMVWEEQTGYNKLGHTITVTEAAANSPCTSRLKVDYPHRYRFPVVFIHH